MFYEVYGLCRYIFIIRRGNNESKLILPLDVIRLRCWPPLWKTISFKQSTIKQIQFLWPFALVWPKTIKPNRTSVLIYGRLFFIVSHLRSCSFGNNIRHCPKHITSSMRNWKYLLYEHTVNYGKVSCEAVFNNFRQRKSDGNNCCIYAHILGEHEWIETTIKANDSCGLKADGMVNSCRSSIPCCRVGTV